MLQLVRYGGSCFALQEQGEEWHPAKHKIAGADLQDRSRGRLVQLGGGRIHGPCGRQLELLKGAEKGKTGSSMSSGPRVQVGIMGWISCDMQVSPWTTWDYLRVHFVKTVLGQWAYLGLGRSYP